MGLVRGAYFSRGMPPDDPDQRTQYIAAGSLVQDGRAWKVALDALWRYVGTDREGQLARFESPAAIRRIADWEFGTYMAALVLARYGVTLARLREWGISTDSVRGAGIDTSLLGDDDTPKDETPEEKKAREEAERELSAWGISPAALERFGGARAVLRAYAQLSKLDDDKRGKLIDRYKQRAEQAEQRAEKVDAWLKDELRRQLKDLTELRDQAPALETIGRVELEEKIRPFMTTDAPPLAEAWSEPYVVTHPIEFQPNQQVTQLKLEDPRRFLQDMIVRVRARDGSRPPEFRYCVGVRRDTAVLLFPQLDWEYDADAAEVSVHMPAPLCVNTAKREVLEAALTGLMSRVGQTSQPGVAREMVTPDEARAIAEAIIADPPANHQALRGLLLDLQAKGTISPHDVDAVFRDAVDPMDPVLLRSTVPFCYRTGDVYELTATGIVNDPQGVELARRRFREAVQVAPPRDLTWTIDSQWDFTDRLYVGGPLGPGIKADPLDGGVASLFLEHAWTNLLQTRPIYLGPYSAVPGGFPSQSHAPGEGDIQPLLSHEPKFDKGSTDAPTYPAPGQNGNPSGGPKTGALRQEDYDGQLEGAPLQGSLGPGEVGVRHFQREDGTVVTAVGPGAVRAWVRVDAPPAAGARAYVFDGGVANGIDRLSCYFDGPQALVLSLDDEAMDVREAAALGLPPRATELRLPLSRPVRAGNWYHVAAAWKGADPTDLSLMLDGHAGGTVNLGSRLSGPIDAFTGAIPVEDASSFPPSGWVRVGGYRWAQLPTKNDRGLSNTSRDADASCEVLHYSQKQGNVLVVDTGPDATLTQLLAQGATLAGPLPQGYGNQLPTSMRHPGRGSGTQVPIALNVPGAPQTPTVVPLTLGAAWPQGTSVVPYGYHCELKDEVVAPQGATAPPYQEVLRKGGATLTQPLPRTTPVTLLYAPVPGYTTANAASNPSFDYYPQVVDQNATALPVLWAAAYPDAPQGGQLPPRPQPPPGQPVQTSPPRGVEALPNQLGGWPPMGIVRVTSNKQGGVGVAGGGGGAPGTIAGNALGQQSVERIFYNGIDPVGGRLLNCVRGVEGTTASPHFLWDTVVLESIVVSDPTDYPDRAALTDPRVYVSLTQAPGTASELTEWLSVQKAQDPRWARRLFLIPARDSLDVAATGGVRGAARGAAGQTGLLPQFPNIYRQDLIAQMLKAGGDLGAAPGLTLCQVSTAYDFGQPYKEVLKRWEVSQARAQKNTQKPPAATGHPAGLKVVPTFAVRAEDRWEADQGDILTVVDDAQGASPPREEARVVHGAECDRARPGTPDPGDACDGWLIAFDDFVQREYQGARHARLARWPVGNLHSVPTLTLGAARPPGAPGEVVDGAPGVLQGKVDDLSSHELLVRLDGTQPIDAQATSMLLQGDPKDLQRGRLYRLDDEVVAVVDATPGTPPPGARGQWANVTLLRGALGTKPAAHGGGLGWRLFWPPFAIAEGGFAGARGEAVPVRVPQGDFRDAYGYVAVDRGYQSYARWSDQPYPGVLPFVGKKNDHLERPIDAFGRGTFDHAFGGEVVQPQARDLLIDLPFRVHDRYADRTWSYDGVFFQAGKELPGAYVEKVDWDETLPSPYCEVKVAVRLDGAPSWDAEPADRPGLPGRLYVFDDPKEANEVLCRADRVELRVYLTFKPQAFYEDAWKLGALVGAVRVHYRQPTRSLRREERTE
jgi:hypothetical protein